MNHFKFIRLFRQIISFYKRDFTSPAPTLFKLKTLEHFAIKAGAWVETGTFKGETTAFLAKRFSKVITLEPSPHFFDLAKANLSKYRNVSILHASSEEKFEECLITVAPKANLWLDGHFSGGKTFHAESISPIAHELSIVKKHKGKFTELLIFIDDIRLFSGLTDLDNDTNYPSLRFVTDWCFENRFEWRIENDIMIAKLLR